MDHLDKLEAPLRDWVRVLMLPPEGLVGEDAAKRRRIEAFISPKQKQALRLFYGYNMTQKEICTLLKANIKTFAATLDNARKRLRKLEAGGDMVRRPQRKTPAGAGKSCRTCAYSCIIGNDTICDYIGMTGRSRVGMGIKKENGLCSLWTGRI